jgi:hypothetical protein
MVLFLLSDLCSGSQRSGDLSTNSFPRPPPPPRARWRPGGNSFRSLRSDSPAHDPPCPAHTQHSYFDPVREGLPGFMPLPEPMAQMLAAIEARRRQLQDQGPAAGASGSAGNGEGAASSSGAGGSGGGSGPVREPSTPLPRGVPQEAVAVA